MKDSSCDVSGDIFNLNESPIMQKDSNAQENKKRGVLFSMNQCWTSLNQNNHGGGRKLLMS